MAALVLLPSLQNLCLSIPIDPEIELVHQAFEHNLPAQYLLQPLNQKMVQPEPGQDQKHHFLQDRSPVPNRFHASQFYVILKGAVQLPLHLS